MWKNYNDIIGKEVVKSASFFYARKRRKHMDEQNMNQEEWKCKGR